MQIRIEQSTLENLQELTELFDRYMVFYQQPSDPERHSQYLRERMENGEADIFLAYLPENPKPVGFTLVYETFSSVILGRMLILNDLYVLREFRKTGVGQALMERVKELGEQKRAKRITLRTAIDNHTAQSLYEQYGFERDERFYTYHFRL